MVIKRHRRVAVIGAGMAGATAAVHLAHQGCTVTVFDKGRAPLGGEWPPL